MARFFLALGVRRQHVPGALPDVPPAPEFPADGVLRQPAPGFVVDVSPQQGHGPVQARIAQVIGPTAEGLLQPALQRRGPQAGPAPAVAVPEGLGAWALLVGLHPVVDTLPAHPEPFRHFAHRLPVIQRQDGDGPAVEARTGGGVQARSQEFALARGQFNLAHVPLPLHGTDKRGSLSKTFCGLT